MQAKLDERTGAAVAAANGYRMPAEWAPHARCLVAWPTRDELWGAYAGEARREYAAVIAAISRFEPVLVVAAPGLGREVRDACGAAAEVVELPLDDSWIRDSGPIMVAGRDGALAGVDFRFNAWGGRFHPFADDDRLSERLLAWLGIPRIASPMVLEGGSITVDGEGTLITTEQCLLNPNRNPGWSRARIEGELRRCLGIETVVWLPFGSAEDSLTDGHVDGVCAFVRPGVVMLQMVADPQSPYFARYEANRRRLMEARDARGRAFEVIEVGRLPHVDVGGRQVRLPSVNFYLANGGVVAPVADREAAAPWLEILGQAFPGREVAPVEVRILPWNGGAIHCITQQVPRGIAANG